MRYEHRKILSALLIVTAAGCGGGGGGSDPQLAPEQNNPQPNNPTPSNPDPNNPDPNNPDPNNPDPNNPDPNNPDPNNPDPNNPPPAAAPMVMTCVDGADFQCSGSSVLSVDNGVSLTNSGVEVFGTSTNDIGGNPANAATAFGLAPTTQGVAEIRLQKDANGQVTSAALLLDDLGLSWDGTNDRPPIIDVFRDAQGRTTLDAQGRLTANPLPPSSDLSFYDYANLGAGATQANYANNAYFPRAEESRCGTGGPSPCPTTEIVKRDAAPGDWQTGGFEPSLWAVTRLHSDGDLFAGDGLPSQGGLLPGATGHGTAYPGFKGYRELSNWSYRYSNLSMWLTQDTVNIAEFGSGLVEHNKNRRGMVAFGDATAPDSVPATGTASYAGIVYGVYSTNGTEEVKVFRANATLTVDFATRASTVTIADTIEFDGTMPPLPAIAVTATSSFGAAGTDLAGYMTSAAQSGPMTGGMGVRFFGPVANEGAGAGPAEAGGTFRLHDAATGATAIGGFIARKQ